MLFKRSEKFANIAVICDVITDRFHERNGAVSLWTVNEVSALNRGLGLSPGKYEEAWVKKGFFQRCFGLQ
jgi:hypothetical protein